MTTQDILQVINAYQNHVNDFVNVDYSDLKEIQESLTEQK